MVKNSEKLSRINELVNEIKEFESRAEKLKDKIERRRGVVMDLMGDLASVKTDKFTVSRITKTYFKPKVDIEEIKEKYPEFVRESISLAPATVISDILNHEEKSTVKKVMRFIEEVEGEPFITIREIKEKEVSRRKKEW